MCENWRKTIPYLEDRNLQLHTKDRVKKVKVVPPKIKGKHCTNLEFLANAELKWLTPKYETSKIYDESSDNSFFEQCFSPCGKLGEGSYGSVIKVTSLDDNKLYAMKVSKEPFKNDYDRRLKVREVEHHKSLSGHLNIVRLYKAWEEDRFIFMQLELCKPSIEDGSPLPEDACWNVLADILQALDVIHDSGRGHFDVKVDNILLGDDNLYKLSDFGLMFNLGEARESYKEGDAKYVAPELVLGGRNSFTPKADIFSLGISVLELAGNLELPNHGDVWCALRENIFPLTQTEHLSDDLFRLLMKMMSKDPAERPTVKEILEMPKMKAVIAQRNIVKLKAISSSVKSFPETISFFVSCAMMMSMAIIKLIAFAIVEKDKLTKEHNQGTKSENQNCSKDSGTSQNDLMETDTDTDEAEWSASTSFGSSVIEASCSASVVLPAEDLAENSSAASEIKPLVEGPLSSSTPMCSHAISEEYVGRKTKRIKIERMMNVGEPGPSGLSGPPVPPPPLPPQPVSPRPNSPRQDPALENAPFEFFPLPTSPRRVSPPPSQIRCDWVSLTSPHREMRETSINRNRLHCPSESLLPYGISPLRLSKACKREYQARKGMRRMSPRNLSLSFDEEDTQNS